uniref:Uncharacterized protein n=1 Tax=Tanacetum cinerariifolium TaxID=118510 RepID=A0A699QU23_TANCI|nr:hypothetical protein [Tanacetum cinerariifolium]
MKMVLLAATAAMVVTVAAMAMTVGEAPAEVVMMVPTGVAAAVGVNGVVGGMVMEAAGGEGVVALHGGGGCGDEGGSVGVAKTMVE